MYEAELQKKAYENKQPNLCSICSMSFANYSNRIHHEANVDGLKAPKKTDSEQDESDNESIAPSSEEQSEPEYEEDEEEETNELEAWKSVIHQVLTGLPHNIDDILKPTTWNNFVLCIKTRLMI